ncbi:MAG: ACT domain-containing protein [Clostridia bacterium]|nr:ACT domain-containing protein [Clostridia bacterium]
MKLEVLEKQFTICKLSDESQIDYGDDFYFIGKTDEEISLVCHSECVPVNATEYNSGWRAFRIQGQLDFSLVGVVSKISTLMADNRISVFVISTYNTDYILIKDTDFSRALKLLEEAAYTMVY